MEGEPGGEAPPSEAVARLASERGVTLKLDKAVKVSFGADGITINGVKAEAA